MDTLGLQLERELNGAVAANSNVIFENVVNSFGLISYNPLTGIITINKTGRYFINWRVATQTTLSPEVSFSIVTSQGDQNPGSSPAKLGETVGFALI